MPSAAETNLDARPPEPVAFDLRSFLRRRWGSLVAVTLVVWGAVAFRVLTDPPIYTAEASLFVRLGREFVYRPEVGTAQPARGHSVAEMVNSEVELLTTRGLAEKVVDRMGVEELYPELFEEEEVDPDIAFERGVLRFRDSVEVRPIIDSSVIKVSYGHVRPDLAARAVNFLVQYFTDKHLEVHAEDRSSFLETQWQQQEANLNQAEERLRDFKQESRIHDLSEQRALLLQRHSALETGLDAVRFRIAEIEQEVGPANGGDRSPVVGGRLPDQKSFLMAQLGEMEKELVHLELDPFVDAAAEAHKRLLELRVLESDLLRNFKETSRSVRAIRRGIETVEGILETFRAQSGGAQRERRDRLLAEIERLTREIASLERLESLQELLALRTRRGEIERELETLREQVRTLDAHGTTLRRLEREVALGEASVQAYMAQVQEARVAEDLDRQKHINVKIVEPAVAPIEPSGLSLRLKLALGGFVGLLAGASLALFLDLVRPR